jgi:murein L,D-transpeptidase YafK
MGVWGKLFLAAEMQRDRVEEVAKNFWRQWEESYDCVEEKEKEEGELEVESHGGGMVYFFVLLGYVNFYE